MSVNFTGLAVVKWSAYFQMGLQVAVIDRWMSALNAVPGTAWNSTALFAQMVTDALPTFLKTAVSNDATLMGAKLSLAVAGGPPLIDRDVTISGPCFGGAGQLPQQSAALLRFSSSVGGKRGHGRMYIPFPYTLSVGVDGLLGVAYKSAVRDIGLAFTPGFSVPNVGVGGGTLTIRPCTKYVTPTLNLAFAMTGSSVANGFATQRRRGFFGKPNSPVF